MIDDTRQQYDFSQQYRDISYDSARRKYKAEKIVAILQDHLGDLNQLRALDIGCSTGYGTATYASVFKHVTAIDVDEAAVTFAKTNNASANIEHYVMDAQKITLPSAAFDVVICSHVYEHVPDPALLLAEIDRLLTSTGVCYFAAGNRLSLMEPHYRLPLLSIIPKRVAHLYLRLTGRGKYYQERHLTYWGLKKLVRKFSVADYTIKVAQNPEKYHALDLMTSGSIKQKFVVAALRLVYWACPTYLWLLRKHETTPHDN